MAEARHDLISTFIIRNSTFSKWVFSLWPSVSGVYPGAPGWFNLIFHASLTHRFITGEISRNSQTAGMVMVKTGRS